MGDYPVYICISHRTVTSSDLGCFEKADDAIGKKAEQVIGKNHARWLALIRKIEDEEENLRLHSYLILSVLP